LPDPEFKEWITLLKDALLGLAAIVTIFYWHLRGKGLEEGSGRKRSLRSGEKPRERKSFG